MKRSILSSEIPSGNILQLTLCAFLLCAPALTTNANVLPGSAAPTDTSIVVSGIVTDSEGSVLPGVNVVLKGTTLGTTTDTKGSYRLTMPEGDNIIVFSFIGFKTFEVNVQGRSRIDMTLETDVAVLTEVTISGGYYETSDKNKTGNIYKVTAKEIENRPVTSPLMALQGKVPGVEVTPSSGAPGVAPRIRIRGTNSLRQGNIFGPETEGNYPLYVIDGVPVNSEPLQSRASSALSFTGGGYDPLSTINLSDIEAIEVLKDGDATAMYGSRGANGVILITTKRGSRNNERTNINLTAYTGFGQIAKEVNVLNLNQYLTMRKEAIRNNGIEVGQEQANDYDLTLWDTTRSTNWQKVLLGGTSKVLDVQTGLSSGTKNTSFNFTAGYHRETLIFPGDFGYYKLSGQLSINHVSTDNKFKASLSNAYGFDNNQLFIGSVLSSALTLPPNAPNLYNNDGSLNWARYDIAGDVQRHTWTNPVSFFKNTQNTTTRNNVWSGSLSYELISGLSLSATGGYTDLSSRESYKTPRSSFPNPDAINSATFVDNKRSSWIVEPKISSTKQIGGHNFSLVVGGTWQKNSNSWYIANGMRYASDALLSSLKGAQIITITRDDVMQYRYVSAYGRLGYNWNEKYILNITGRRDGSSRFGPGNRFGNFGAVGAAWLFSKEKWISQKLTILDFGKIRTSYGITGSDNIGDYNYYSLYDIDTRKYGGVISITPTGLYNPEYAWEVTKKLEAAIELSLWKSKVGLEVSWYRNRSSNQLVNYPLSEVAGFGSVLKNFDATVENSGWEGILRFDLLNSDSWRWNTSLNVSLPTNKLIKFDGINESAYVNYYKVGEPLSIQSLYTWTGVNRETGLNQFVDRNNDGIFNPQDKTLQNLTGRIIYGGISNTVQYKGIDISFLIQFSKQRSQRFMPDSPGMAGINQPVDVMNRWQHPGEETNVQRFVSVYSEGGTSEDALFDQLRESNYNSVDASFVRLKTISLSLRLPAKWLTQIGSQEGRIFVQGQNLLTLTDFDGLDPETGFGLPPLRMFTLGAQLKF
jgi:TonB-dependent starch-binding outer membrane protein SusC